MTRRLGCFGPEACVRGEATLVVVTQTAPLPVSDELATRLQAQSDAIGLPAPALAASLLDEGLKTRQYPGIVYKDGPAGRRASLAGGPDVWQVIRALNEVPAEEPDPVETVSIEADLHPQQVGLALKFYKAYPDEIDNMIAIDLAAVGLIDEMAVEGKQTAAERQAYLPGRTKRR